MTNRCSECGSWDRECSSEKTVVGCGCARCLSAALDTERNERKVTEAALRDTMEKLVVVLRERNEECAAHLATRQELSMTLGERAELARELAALKAQAKP